MKSRKTSSAAKRLRNAPGKNRVNNSNGPPQLFSNIRLSHRYRFLTSGAFSHTVNSQDLLNCAGTIGTVVNSTVALMFESVRVRALELWAPPASQGSASTVSCEWLSANSPSIEVSDTTVSVTRNAHIRTNPPSLSLASFWQNVDTVNNLFTLVCPANTIIDVSLELVLVDRSGAAGTQVALTTVVVGHVYYLALDSSVPAHVAVPVSLNTTF
jgi:hypothetical protein